MTLDDIMSDKIDIAAKNLLQNRNCDNCVSMMKQDVKRCYFNRNRKENNFFEPLVCPKVNTCDCWNEKYVPNPMEFLELM